MDGIIWVIIVIVIALPFGTVLLNAKVIRSQNLQFARLQNYTSCAILGLATIHFFTGQSWALYLGFIVYLLLLVASIWHHWKVSRKKQK